MLLRIKIKKLNELFYVEKILFGLIFLIFIFSTNKKLNWDSAISYLQAHDTSDAYEPIAISAPYLLNKDIPHHKAQRFIIPFFIGIVGKFFSIEHRKVFRMATIFCISTILMLLIMIEKKNNLSIPLYLICIGQYILNPYVFRYYLLVPGNLCDLYFVLGTALLIFGLSYNRITLIILGITIGIIARQTMFLLLPGVLFWINYSNMFDGRSTLMKKLIFSIIIAIPVAIYCGADVLSKNFSEPSLNLNHITEIFYWFKSDNFSPIAFLELIVRICIPYLFICIFWIIKIYFFKQTKKKLSTEIISLFLMSFFISLQPILAGPVVTGSNASRLGSLGLFPAVAGLMLMFKTLKFSVNARDSMKIILILLGLLSCILLASFHHMYTKIGPSSAIVFTFDQILFALSAGVLFFNLLRIGTGKS